MTFHQQFKQPAQCREATGGNGEAEYMNIVDVVDGCDMVFEHDIND